MESFVWTGGQVEGIQKVKSFLNSDQPFFLLSGSAGSGKSTVAGLIPSLVTNGEVVCTGPTHKSVGVLREKMEGIECMTIHKFLGLRPKKVKDKTILTRSRLYDPADFSNVRVVLFDEVSMAGNDLMKYATQDAHTWDRKYVLLGDRYQLSPPSEEQSPVFNLPLPDECKHELTEVVRQASDNPIIALATRIRDAIIAGKEPPSRHMVSENGVGIHLLKKAQWLAKLDEYIAKPEYLSNPDHLRILAYRNETVMKHNAEVRRRLGHDDRHPFSAGEQVTCTEAWVVDEEVLMNTGEDHLIEDVEPYTHPMYPEIKGYKLELESLPGIPVYVIDFLTCMPAYKDRIRSLAMECNSSGDWRPYYELTEHFADLRPVFAQTVHRSQGSTYDNVAVDYADIYTCRPASEADRCYYVAVTRARYNVFIIF